MFVSNRGLLSKIYPFTVSPAKNALDLVTPRRSFYKGLSRSASPRGIKKQQLEIVKKKTRVLFILLSTALFETTRESTNCLTTLLFKTLQRTTI